MSDHPLWPVFLGFMLGTSMVAIFLILYMHSVDRAAFDAVSQALSACKEFK